jgi:hypothetical protein
LVFESKGIVSVMVMSSIVGGDGAFIGAGADKGEIGEGGGGGEGETIG